ncbi:VCBS repeat-containing protein [Microvirga sp. STS02]|uniref:FG-GAP-like repeat-containing protein n=1 Tax=Hymenobacter negativus TaxID=2795026 RepID=UPI0018DD0BD2|nr:MULTISPECIES: FG-GAP-like repeat-containing protein [Bacteria]MBH8570722.1 VCBS repeat-containing protein [Hymenobacter negativus]MBR7210459.1 VCBS repeat-containing protein [Microvirga sp. STS02]
MTNFYSLPRWTLHTGLLLAPAGVALAQAPIINSITPMANARAAARSGPVTVNFNQPLTAASASALKVFSSQRGGLRTRGTTPAVVSGSTLSFAPTAYDFRPGETVQYTVTTAAASSSGALARDRVGQFTTAVGGTGTGRSFSLPTTNPEVPTNDHPGTVVLGDLDGDGDLDFVTACQGSTANPGSVRVYFNNGRGEFTSGLDVAVGRRYYNTTLGDLDGDGDLDLLIVSDSGMVSVRLNSGNGTFVVPGNTPELALANNAGSTAVGDVDGDGDLDVLISNGNNVSVRLNNGAGVFTVPATNPEVAFISPGRPTLGDLDGDGDLDLLTTNYNGSTAPASLRVRLNDGQGNFTASTLIPDLDLTYYPPSSPVLGDVDGDGDLDALMAVQAGNWALLCLNNGQGGFSFSYPSNSIPIGYSPSNVVLGDMDGDGDLDLIATSEITGIRPPTRNGAALICFNNGQGSFSPSYNTAVSTGSYSIDTAVGDIDGDGDLDFMTANDEGFSVSVRLNGNTGPLSTAAGHLTAPDPALFPNPAHDAVALTGAVPNAPLTVLDALGRVLLTATTDAAGTARLALPAGLPAGVYLVRSGGQVRRLAVE